MRVWPYWKEVLCRSAKDILQLLGGPKIVIGAIVFVGIFWWRLKKHAPGKAKEYFMSALESTAITVAVGLVLFLRHVIIESCPSIYVDQQSTISMLSNQLENCHFELALARDEIHIFKPIVGWHEWANIGLSECRNGRWAFAVACFEQATNLDSTDWIRDRVLVGNAPCYYYCKMRLETSQTNSADSYESAFNAFKQHLLDIGNQIESGAAGAAANSGYTYPESIQGNLNCLDWVKKRGLPDTLASTEVGFDASIDRIIRQTKTSLQRAEANWPNVEKEK
jgi:hypothetical protein